MRSKLTIFHPRETQEDDDKKSISEYENDSVDKFINQSAVRMVIEK